MCNTVIHYCLLVIGFTQVYSYPYDSVYQGEYDPNYEAVVLDVDHNVDLPYYTEGHVDFAKGDGSYYDTNNYNVGGNKGNSGYGSHKDFSKGDVGNYGAEGQKNYYDTKGGQKFGFNDAAKYYKDNHSLVKGSKGGDYAVSNSFKKGSKTTGFHNVHHKEEYQKNKKFYDKSSSSGHYSRYGDFGAALLAAAGKTSQGNQYNSGYKDGEYGKSGFSDRGSLYDNLKKYADANGYKGFYGNYADYGRSGIEGRANAYGYNH